ncbi:MAG: hypothetical protein JW712_02810 [Dehalococcoidales bacterium]|nr:hypothetical protein [Dehalococcoidales bacterium]
MALIITLGFLAIGGITIVSLINLTNTGMRAGHISDEKIRLQYAADAGLEEVLWRMQNEELPFIPGTYGESTAYNLTDSINDKNVSVNVTYIWPLTGLEEDIYTTSVPESLKITGGIINKTQGKYLIQISFDETIKSVEVESISVWLPSRFEYVSGSSTGFIIDDPQPPVTKRGGKVFTWHINETFDSCYVSPSSGGGFTPGMEYPRSLKLYFQATPVNDLAGGSICWIKTNDSNIPLAWETGCELYQMTATASDNTTNRTYSLNGSTYFSQGSSLGEGVYQMKGDYRSIGNTLMTDKHADNIRYQLLESSSANVTDIPTDGEIVLAYLYWAGWREGSSEADTDVLFSINGQGVYFDEFGLAVNGTTNVTASKYSTISTGDGNHFSCFLDVTDLVKLNNPQGNGEYSVANVTAETGNLLSYAGWSLILFYSSPTEDPHQLFIYDQFLYASSGTHTFTIEGFESPANAEATLTVFVGEGDEEWGNSVNEADNPPGYWWKGNWRWTGNVDYIIFNGTYLTDNVTPHINPPFNVWNGKSSGLEGLFIDGVDIDTFDVSSPIIEPGASEATVTIGTNADKFCLIYLVLSFSSEHGGLTPNASGIISYSGGY